MPNCYAYNSAPVPGRDLSTGGRRMQFSTTEAVASIIQRNFVLHEALRMKIMNYHALAVRIAPKVEELTGRKAKLPTLVVSVKRYADGITEERETRLERILEDAKVTLTSGIAEVSIHAPGLPPIEVMKDVLDLTPKLAALPEIAQLPGVVKVLVDDEDSKLVEKELGRRYHITVERRMAKVGFRVSQRSDEVVGLASFITELLFRNGVVIQSAYIGRPDSLLVLEDRFGARAYDILREGRHMAANRPTVGR